MKHYINTTWLALLLLLAALLRFFNYSELAFNSDELSALFRLQFSSFAEMLEKGVKVDGHPAGVQSFLYLWTMLFGTSEEMVKLPFVLMGIASVYLVYLIGKNWFNPTTGLVSAAFVACIQYTIVYSQLARPYSSGLFLSLLMVHFWGKVLFAPRKGFYPNLLLFIASAAACAYNHHFSLLFAFIVGITGLFFIEKNYLARYLLSGLAIFLLYLPHLNIFFYQLGIGGVENWLAKPTPWFLWYYLKFIFHHSYAFLACAAMLALLGFFLARKDRVRKPYFLISLVFFLTPLLVGYFYSVYFTAVLQFSVLIFSFPFLLFMLFGHLPDLPVLQKSALLVSVCLLSSLTLVFGRKHYEIAYPSVYEENVKNLLHSRQTYGDSLLLLLDGYKDANQHYLAGRMIDEVYWLEDISIKEFLLLLQQNQKQKLVLGSVASTVPELVPIILEYYPAMEEKKDYFLGTFYQFSKPTNEGSKHRKLVVANGFEEGSPGWPGMDSTKITESDSFSGKRAYLMGHEQEWGPTLVFALKDWISHRNDFIDISIAVKTSGGESGLVLVSEVESNNKTLEWRGSTFEDFIPENGKGWYKVHHSVKLSDFPCLPGDAQIKIYVWNQSGASFYIDDARIMVRDGNPYLYGIFEEM